MTTSLSEHRAGKLPSRASLNLNVQVGLVNLPLAIYASVDDDARVERKQFTTDGHPIGNRNYDKTTGKNYDGDIVKKTEVTADVWVDLPDDEVESVLGDGVRGTAEVECFVPFDAIGREYVVLDVKQARPRQLESGKSKVDNPGAIAGYALLRRAMAERGVAALVKVTLRTVTRYAALTADGRLLILAYADQVRADRPLADVEPSDKELRLADMLITDVVGIDTPVLVDTDGAALRAYVEAKVAGGDVAKAAKDAPEPEPQTTDLSALLELAIATAKAGKPNVNEHVEVPA